MSLRGLYAGYLATLLVVPYLGATAAPYRWSDNQGRIHYGDQPPPNQAVEPVKVYRSSPPQSAPKPGQRTDENSSAPSTDTPQEAEAPASDAKASSRQVVQENCKIAQRNLEILTTSGRRVHAMGADGKPYVLDQKAREQQLSETRKDIETFCP